MPNDNLQKLNNYFDKYVDKMLIKDILLIKNRNKEFKFSYPYILLVCSCIDLFGAIEKDFTGVNGRGNSEERFEWFIIEWMGKVNPLYKEESLAYLIYDSWRCGVSHQATLKKGFETSSYMYDRDKHLHYIKDKDRVFIHSLQFADDFIEAQASYRKHINDSAINVAYIDSLFQHLSNMMNESKERKDQALEEFIKVLQDNGLAFNSLITNPTTKASSRTSSKLSSQPSFKKTTTQLPDPNDDIWPTVSAAPEEDDLK